MDIAAAIAKHSRYLWSLPHVNGVGQGGRPDRPAITVYVTHRVPEHERVKKTLEGYDVVIEDIGHVGVQKAHGEDETPTGDKRKEGDDGEGSGG